jgi:hypothetical protein
MPKAYSIKGLILFAAITACPYLPLIKFLK